MATPYATPDDVAITLNVVFDDGQKAQCTRLLAGVSAIMRSRLPLLDSWLATGKVDQILAQQCAIDMASSRINVTQARGLKSEQHPEYTVVFADGPLSGVDVTDDWRGLLTPPETRDEPQRAFSVRPG